MMGIRGSYGYDARTRTDLRNLNRGSSRNERGWGKNGKGKRAEQRTDENTFERPTGKRKDFAYCCLERAKEEASLLRKILKQQVIKNLGKLLLSRLTESLMGRPLYVDPHRLMTW
jgi:hypothetical protein